jgi:hypothetical protein
MKNPGGRGWPGFSNCNQERRRMLPKPGVIDNSRLAKKLPTDSNPGAICLAARHSLAAVSLA